MDSNGVLMCYVAPCGHSFIHMYGARRKSDERKGRIEKRRKKNTEKKS